MNTTRQAIVKAHQDGKCLEAELEAELSQLARQMRQAIGDAHEAGYRQARYITAPGDGVQAREAKEHAQQLEDVAVRTMWQLFYDVASKVAPKGGLSCSCSTKMAASHLAERGQA
jgi:hypothetical protein